MKKLLLLTILLTSALQASVSGEDDRISFNDLERINPASMAKATATQLSKRYLKDLGDHFSYPTGALQNQCPGEKFAKELTLGGCSGFLIGEKLLVAAGHCKDYSANGCDDDAWLINHFSPATPKKQIIDKSNLYYCKKVHSFKHDGEGDFVVIELDRKVKNIRPLELDLKGEGKKGDPVAVLGYPLGRSLTYTPGGRIISKDKNYLRVDSDAFKNNSGSALVNLRTGKVEGVLTNSRKGLSLNSLDGCQLAKSYKENIVLVNRLRRIDYLKEVFKFESEKKSSSLINNCQKPVQMTLKYRQSLTNDWLTVNKDLLPNEEFKVTDFKSEFLYINIRDSKGSSLVKGSDFWGFANSNRDQEFGFKKLKATEALFFCQE